MHARHILVDTKEEAEKIIDDLKGGASFEELAKQSKDPSGQNGGDLGFFGEGQMVPEFEKAAFALEPGQFTQEPVQTQFGWHVIKVEEKRMSAAAGLRRGGGAAAQLPAAAEVRDGARRRCATSIRSRSSTSRPRPAMPRRGRGAGRRRAPKTVERLDRAKRWRASSRRSRRPPIRRLPALDGVRLATAEAGIRYKGRTDLLLVRFDPAATVAGVFTQSRCASAPVDWDRERLTGGKARALVVNSGNANAFTGMKGRQAVEATRRGGRDGARLRARRGVPRLDRRDRRAARSEAVRRRISGGSPKRRGRARSSTRRAPS